MADVSYYTPEGYQRLKDELHHMKTVERPAISQQIAEARDKGDLSENAEYDAATSGAEWWTQVIDMDADIADEFSCSRTSQMLR